MASICKQVEAAVTERTRGQVEESLKAPDPFDGEGLSDLATIYNQYGKVLQDEAQRLGLSAASLAGLMKMGSSGRAFDREGRLLVAFSPELFHRYWGKRHESVFASTFSFKPGFPGKDDLFRPPGSSRMIPFHHHPDREWEALDAAIQMAGFAALRSTCMGLGQIMGFNYHKSGFTSVEEMFERMALSARAQVEGWIQFIWRNSGTFSALKRRDYLEFAKLWYENPSAPLLAQKIEQAAGEYRTLTASRELPAA
jgi:hypothetical protein